MPSPERVDLDDIEEVAFDEFNRALDYLWKSPDLLRNLESKEREKLARYFPDNSHLCVLRWNDESVKLFDLFPKLLVNGNLFAACSLFEFHLLTLARYLDSRSDCHLADTKGKGVGRLLEYLRCLGVKTNQLPLWPQVDAAIKIRNCLSHLGGVVERSREEREIQRIVTSRSFLSPEDRLEAKREYMEELHNIRIDHSDAGSKLSITPLYPWAVCAYLRDYLLSVYAVVRVIFNGGHAT